MASSSISTEVVVLMDSNWGLDTCLSWRLTAAKAREEGTAYEAEIGPSIPIEIYLFLLESDLPFSLIEYSWVKASNMPWRRGNASVAFW